MKKSILKNIIDQCKKELHKHPEKNHFAHWTFIYQYDRLISKGMNRSYEPPKSFGYHGKEPSYKPKWHSEADAVKRARYNLVNCVAVNVRLNKSGQIRFSAPCQTCRNILYVINCRKVYFTTEYGWGVIRLSKTPRIKYKF